eukprot:TRINITY_DN979_c0_g1_i2.p1 TRINITY_DN979_c0_g1~~TRINITY_DN979_c0_g1_i2.p1  ORF type:complete len:591 (+),score=155.47 TRINITY_DN979_c0_g1_i2:188-1960(+)
MGTTSSKNKKRNQRKHSSSQSHSKRSSMNQQQPEPIIQTYEAPLIVIGESNKVVEQEKMTNSNGSVIDKSKKGSRREPAKDIHDTTKFKSDTKEIETGNPPMENPDHNTHPTPNSVKSTSLADPTLPISPKTIPHRTRSKSSNLASSSARRASVSSGSMRRRLVARLVCGSYSDRGQRRRNEDCIVCIPSMKEDPDAAFFAVYDGHGGRKAASYCQEYLHKNITTQPSYPRDLKDAVIKGFLETDQKYHKDVDDGGTTVLTTLIRRIKRNARGEPVPTATSARSNLANEPQESGSDSGSASGSASGTDSDASSSDYSSSEEDNDTASGSESSETTPSAPTRDTIVSSTSTSASASPREDCGEEYILLIANAGDCRAVGGVRQRGEGKSKMIAVALSRDHKPAFDDEKKRIEAAGHTVEINTFQKRDEKSNNPLNINRVDGLLSVSRGIGDWAFKDRDDLPAASQAVTAVPDILQIPLWPSIEIKSSSTSQTFDEIIDDAHNPKLPTGLIPESHYYRFIILGCDGIWDVLSNADAVGFVGDRLDALEEKKRGAEPITHDEISYICEELIAHSIAKDATDNVSAVIIVFQQD